MDYVIAVRRGHREEAGADWAASLESVDGLRIVGDSNPYRLRIEASEEAIEVARELYADLCHIEPVIPLYPLDSEAP